MWLLACEVLEAIQYRLVYFPGTESLDELVVVHSTLIGSDHFKGIDNLFNWLHRLWSVSIGDRCWSRVQGHLRKRRQRLLVVYAVHESQSGPLP